MLRDVIIDGGGNLREGNIQHIIVHVGKRTLPQKGVTIFSSYGGPTAAIGAVDVDAADARLIPAKNFTCANLTLAAQFDSVESGKGREKQEEHYALAALSLYFGARVEFRFCRGFFFPEGGRLIFLCSVGCVDSRSFSGKIENLARWLGARCLPTNRPIMDTTKEPPKSDADVSAVPK